MNKLQQLPGVQNDIQDAWEIFVDTGRFDHARPRDSISRSWLSSRETGINPLQERAPTVYDHDQLDAMLHEEQLGLVGKQVLDKMASVVEGSAHVVVLADAGGRIVYSVGHEGIQDRLEKINFCPGADWSENSVGANGVGTPLALDCPEVVLGSEHYCIGWKPWNCYGSPVHNPSDRSVLGCIDITGPADSVQKPGMALVVSIAQTIESELSLLHLRQREQLRRHFNEYRHRYPGDASILVDSWGVVQDISHHIPDFLDLDHSVLNRLDIQSCFPALWQSISSVLENGNPAEAEIATRHYPYTNNCVILPVSENGEHTGVIITVCKPGIKTVQQADVQENVRIPGRHDRDINRHGNDLQKLKDELIKSTLQENNGNISKTARQLGINRSTIYRRLGQMHRPGDR